VHAGANAYTAMCFIAFFRPLFIAFKCVFYCRSLAVGTIEQEHRLWIGLSTVDFEGCPIFAGALQDVDFPADEADLNNRARRSLDKLVLRLQRYPEVVLAIDAHTDNRGSGQVNLELSKRRVMAVVRYLVARGVPPHQLRPYGYGESRPIISNATPEGRRQNRRIEVSVVLQPEAGEPLVEPGGDPETPTGSQPGDST